MGRIVDGTPLVALKDDQWQDEIMKGMRLDANDIMAAARTKGLRDLSQIKYAILERNGTISIIKKG
ncbi:YetF domain-containing protein [Silvibacterium bohemicum]|uniref:YetF domain-containing protein n=1 Tax=Silvibacterium bohemicum TaxID=1577686 RepID=UPI0009E37407